MPKITKRIIDSQTPNDKKFFVWDSEVKGFGLAVFPSGVMSYVFQYRNEYGRTERLTIGKHGDLTPDHARKLAKQHAANVMNGENPAHDKKVKRQALSVNELFDEYLRSQKFSEKAETTQATDKGRINRHLRPLIGSKIASTLTAEDIRRVFSNIRDGKTACDIKTVARGRAIVKGGEGAARMACRVLRAILSWAVVERLITENPAAKLSFGSDGKRDLILESSDDYQRLFRTLDDLESTRKIRPEVADIIRILALTGTRKNEIAALRWHHVRLDAGVIVLPPNAHKTGAKTGEKIISLPSVAQAIISRQPRGSANDYVFPPSKGDSPISLSKPWRMVRELAQLPKDIGLHGLRHSIGTMLALQGAESAQIMAVLGHTQLSTTARYIHMAEQARREILERHTSSIGAALENKKSAEVMAFRKAEL